MWLISLVNDRQYIYERHIIVVILHETVGEVRQEPRDVSGKRKNHLIPEQPGILPKESIDGK